MTDMNVVLQDGLELGSGGSVVMTGSSTGRPSLPQTIADIAADIAAMVGTGAPLDGVTPTHTAASIPVRLGRAGAHVFAGARLSQLRQLLANIAIDIAALDAAGAYGLTLQHRLTSLPADFLDGGAHMIPRRDGLAYQAGDTYKYIGDALQAIAVDLDAINTAGTLGLTLATIKKA